MALVYALFSAFFAALVAIFAKLGLKNIDSDLATAMRSIIMAVFLVGFVLITGKFNSLSLKGIEIKDWFLIIFSGVAGAISWLFYFYAIKISNNETSKVVAIDKLSIVFVAILAGLILKESQNWNVILGVIIMSLGAILISLR